MLVLHLRLRRSSAAAGGRRSPGTGRRRGRGRDLPAGVRAAQVADLLADDAFRLALPGHLRGDAPGQARLPTVALRLHRIRSDDEEQALLRTMLDHIMDAEELPQVQSFRPAHEPHRSLLGDLVDKTMLKAERGRYALTAAGLSMCLPGRASSEVARCSVVIDELKAMYRSDPERLWPMRELAERINESVGSTARAVTFLSASPASPCSTRSTCETISRDHGLMGVDRLNRPRHSTTILTPLTSVEKRAKERQ